MSVSVVPSSPLVVVIVVELVVPVLVKLLVLATVLVYYSVIEVGYCASCEGGNVPDVVAVASVMSGSAEFESLGTGGGGPPSSCCVLDGYAAPADVCECVLVVVMCDTPSDVDG